ncbi:hypothetical protein [Streptomyces sp. NPDC050485]|uniref:hypothetical protein n=1 Tax=Streptomyces sp. NPDC050485 TaxID=3365617 RepID=UPI0037935788
MGINHIVGQHLRRKRRTTVRAKTAPPAPDLVMRDFTADVLDAKWCGAIAYIAVGSTWLYLAAAARVGSSYDDALAESFFQGLKRELLRVGRRISKAQNRLELFRWLASCNRRRRYSARGYLTRAEFEQQLIASRTLSPVA